MEQIPTLMLEYFEASVRAYNNWGKDLDRPGLYSLHSGFTVENKNCIHYEELQEYRDRLVDFANIDDGFYVLDAGCGTGTISYEIAARFPNARLYGINLSRPQLETAQEFKGVHKITNIYFSYQNYNRMAFNPNVFDTIIFCESFCYSLDKPQTLTEVRRVLKPEGNVVIADCFTRGYGLTGKELEQKKLFEDGFKLAPIVSIDEAIQTLKDNGFMITDKKDISQNILPSASAIAQNSQRRLAEKSPATDIITSSRYACVAMEQIMLSGGLKYFYIRGQKN